MCLLFYQKLVKHIECIYIYIRWKWKSLLLVLTKVWRYHVHLGLSANGCSVDNYRCQNIHEIVSICIPSEWLCDGEIDCLDASDEAACDGKNIALYYIEQYRIIFDNITSKFYFCNFVFYTHSFFEQLMRPQVRKWTITEHLAVSSYNH